MFSKLPGLTSAWYMDLLAQVLSRRTCVSQPLGHHYDKVLELLCILVVKYKSDKYGSFQLSQFGIILTESVRNI